MRTLFIANRGEVAVRIQRAARGLGLATVQACSEADVSAEYVRRADASVCIGPGPAAASYLDAGRVVLAALAAGADAVHPGYGFLSENAAFADKVERAGLVFVGPPASAIHTMGDKVRARTFMLAAGVPCLPGSDGALPEDPAACRGIAAQIGYPVIVKAAGGGGGRGMRVVTAEADLLPSIELTRAEAKAAFANSEVYLERYLTTPRHVEIQIVMDAYGNGVWLGERDCSIQRRHQKVIEEAPAPGVGRTMLAEVAGRCLEACQRMAYRGVGTFEFLYENGDMFFIEMNTRLQVEHPVTEAITGIDIVEAQLRIAAGESLWFRQDDVTFSGHAIECRINAEDGATGRPSPGRIERFRAPVMKGVRVDTHVGDGYVVPPFYDSMIAKLIVHGESRAAAVETMRAALADLHIDGISTNITLHRDLLADPGFCEGGTNIHYLETKLRKAAP
ncbi:MAG TPA: acetyl-CoA carboxylase biotin carboxylase subunit [Shinella sp.]|jgi:acetyl-CoA carboxylase biotin carboxylase subunit|uniref:acetyl-CoA carboxylase biotin carboxylase subunit n=1 Tax=Shinella sp. TaxID=1870904 RepID=UPI0029B6ED36|nr:acetyl-CoA carboxylase biotin carboxylase subunit [Shinella sp.]MDX3978465.1 acetyl-CoA carboxylase biotin carboxylase subunit [Shinella sp.]HEV7245469.1 acetyl-CoA carboxylase biotin carboxylase subunit [Shinella sp.]